MSKNRKKFAWIVAAVLVVAFLGDYLGYWEMASWISTGGPDNH